MFADFQFAEQNVSKFCQATVTMSRELPWRRTCPAVVTERIEKASQLRMFLLSQSGAGVVVHLKLKDSFFFGVPIVPST